MYIRLVFILIAISVIAIIFLAWLWLRRPMPRTISPDRLSYPCLRIVDDRSWDQVHDETQLRTMSSDRFMNRKADPILIDSEFRVFEMAKLNMKGSTLSLLITGPRQIQVEFELASQSQEGLDYARTVIRKLLTRYTEDLSPDLEQQIQNADSLEELVAALRAAN